MKTFQHCLSLFVCDNGFGCQLHSVRRTNIKKLPSQLNVTQAIIRNSCDVCTKSTILLHILLSPTAFFPAVHILNIIPVPRGISCCLNVEMISFRTIAMYYVGICVDR